MTLDPRRALLAMYQAALRRVSGRESVCRHLQETPLAGDWEVVAIGKAAAAMMQGAVEVLQERVSTGLVITKHGHSEPPLNALPNVRVIESDHPVPSEASLQAGRALLDFLQAAPDDVRFLFLISGGASSLVEVLPEGLGLAELQRVNRWLLGSGLDIEQMNRVRKAISCIKGGRLAMHLQGRTARCLLISDVPGDAPAVIGSGLLAPSPLAVELPALPDWLETWLGQAPPMPQATEACFATVTLEVIANLDGAKRGAAAEAARLGYAVTTYPAFLQGDAVEAAERIVAALRAGPAGVHVWGGETTVRLPAEPGKGGRNQHLALAAALKLEGMSHVYLLAAGTDGTDGPTEDAGALVDGGTIERGELAGLDAPRCLERADAGSFLEASGDLIQTGPTGTNVMDIVIGLKLSDD